MMNLDRQDASEVHEKVEPMLVVLVHISNQLHLALRLLGRQTYGNDHNEP